MRWHFMATMATLGMATFGAAMAAMQGTARAAEIKVISSNGVKAILDELVPQFEKATGHKVTITWGAAAMLKKDIEGGAAFDVIILTAAATDDLIKQGKAKGPSTMIAKSGAGVAVKAGAPKPDISTTDAFKRALLAARAVAYTTQGASGQYFLTVLDRLGIANEIKAKAKTRPGGAIAELVANGEAELAVQQISELMPVKGAAYVGPFPPELQHYTAFTAALGPAPKDPAAAKAFIDFLTAPSAVSVIKAKGMEPG